MKLKDIFLLSLFLLSSMVLNAQQVVPLYPDGKIPNTITDKKKAAPATKAAAPKLTVYLPTKEKASGTAVIVCPGGGYSSLVVKREGHDVAAELVKMGVAAFVLEYRLPNDATMPDKSIGPLQDAQQAIKIVRQRATEWNISPDKIGIMGFSAGGHLASTAATHFKREVIDNKEKTSLRPDFVVLIYPVINMNDTITHKGSREKLLGTAPTPEALKLYSNELQVTSQTPPAFLVHAGDDSKVPVENSLRFYSALLQHKVPAEMHLYPKGEHGFAKGAPIDNWLERCRFWMIGNGWLKKE